MKGPIDFIVVAFEGNRFDGSILKALGDALDDGVIGLVALTVIRKDEEGMVTKLDISESGDRYLIHLAEKYDPSPSAVGEDDIEEVADLLENNTAAGLLVIEQLWAKPLKQAILEAGGELVAEGRIHPEAEAQLSMKEV
jgi:hypothetical protein